MVRPALVKRVAQLGFNSSKLGQRFSSSQVPSKPAAQISQAQKTAPAEPAYPVTPRSVYDSQKCSFKTVEEAKISILEAQEDFKRMKKESDEFTAKIQKNVNSHEKIHKTAADLKYKLDRTYKLFSRTIYAMSALITLIGGTLISRNMHRRNQGGSGESVDPPAD